MRVHKVHTVYYAEARVRQLAKRSFQHLPARLRCVMGSWNWKCTLHCTTGMTHPFRRHCSQRARLTHAHQCAQRALPTRCCSKVLHTVGRNGGHGLAWAFFYRTNGAAVRSWLYTLPGAIPLAALLWLPIMDGPASLLARYRITFLHLPARSCTFMHVPGSYLFLPHVRSSHAQVGEPHPQVPQQAAETRGVWTCLANRRYVTGPKACIGGNVARLQRPAATRASGWCK